MACVLPSLLASSKVCATPLVLKSSRLTHGLSSNLWLNTHSNRTKSSKSGRKSGLSIPLRQCNGLEHTKCFSTTPVSSRFYEEDKKGGYGSKKERSQIDLIRDGFKELKSELAKWQEEVQEKFSLDPIFVRPGDMDKIWNFKKTEDLENWVVTSDSDHNEGFSSGSLTLSPAGHGLFSGELSTRIPEDGRVKSAGYANMKSMQPRKSFKREVYLDWQLYNVLELRVRGDGRSYIINISTSGYFDVLWNDIYSYVLYTRGGPHWQIARIPFSKFFLSSKGRVQDKQAAIPLDRVVSVGITAGDAINAPFRLEVDYVGVYSDPDHVERFAYEMYRVPKFYTN